MKVHLHAHIDENLRDVMRKHCKCNHIKGQDFVAEAIAEKLNIPLNEDHTLDESYYAEYQIREIDNCIDKLKKQRKELEKQL